MAQQMEKPFVPATAELKRGLGPAGLDFEVKLKLDTSFPGHGAGSSSSAPSSSRYPSSSSRGFGGGFERAAGPSALGSAAQGGPAFSDDIVVTIPVPAAVRNITDLRASRGEATFAPGYKEVTWTISTKKDTGTVAGTATLRGTVVGPIEADEDEEEDLLGDEDLDEEVQRDERHLETHASHASRGSQTANALMGYYDDAQQTQASQRAAATTAIASITARSSSAGNSNPRKTASLMPNSVSVSFTVRGWVPSGVRVESLNLDMRRSRGVPETIKPYKGVNTNGVL
ncbi:hypothetical protein KEM56_003066 [Ascosphaera pollenicola]|nr:hypothetical protein KEM56_003066 [Ascosphaera pollenicola]